VAVLTTTYMKIYLKTVLTSKCK